MEKTKGETETQDVNTSDNPTASDLLDEDASVPGMRETGDAANAREDDPAESRTPKPWLRWLGGFTGSLTAGLVIIALLEWGTQGLAFAKDVPGPGVSLVVGHSVAAVIAVGAQWFVDRAMARRRVWFTLALCLVVVVDAFALLFLYWWR